MREAVGTESQRRASTAVAAWTAAGLLFGACLAMWLVIPPMWVWLLSQLGGSGATYALVLLGLPVSLMLWGRVLVRLDALHARAASHMSGDVEERPSWLTPCLTGSLIVALVVLLAAALLGLLPSSSGHAFGPFPD